MSVDRPSNPVNTTELRQLAAHYAGSTGHALNAAADEIERLRAEVRSQHAAYNSMFDKAAELERRLAGSSDEKEARSDKPCSCDTFEDGNCRAGWYPDKRYYCAKTGQNLGSPSETAVEKDGGCQHDLLKPGTTIEVIDPWKARCLVCIQFFDLPGRPPSETAAVINLDEPIPAACKCHYQSTPNMFHMAYSSDCPLHGNRMLRNAVETTE